MNVKRVITYLIMVGLLFTAMSCGIPKSNGTSEEVGSLTIRFDSLLMKSIVPAVDMLIDSYEIVGTHEGGVETFSVSTSGTSVEVEELILGLWTIDVSGKNAAAEVIGFGSTVAEIAVGELTVVSIYVRPNIGDGVLDQTICYEASVVPAASAESTIHFQNDDPIPVTFTGPVLDGLTWKFTATNTLPNGWYGLRTILYDNGSVFAGSLEAVRIVATYTTYAIFEWFEKVFTINITPQMGEELEVTLSGNLQSEMLLSDEFIDIDVSVTDFDSGDIYFHWAVNGQQIAVGVGSDHIQSTMFLSDYDLMVGKAVLQVVAYSIDPSNVQAGQASFEFDITGP